MKNNIIQNSFNSQDKIEYKIYPAEVVTDQYINKEKSEIKDRILYSYMDFTQELLTNEDHYSALSNGLEMLGNATQVDRVYYWENHFDKELKKWFTSQKFEWCLDKSKQEINNPKLQNISFEDVGDFIGILSQNKTFSAHVKDISKKKYKTRQILEDQAILSVLVIPVFVEDEFRGFIGFDSYNFEREWTEVEISLLNSFVLLYEKTIERRNLGRDLEQVKENFNNFFNMIQDLLFVLDYNGNIIDVNQSVLNRMNYGKEELLGQSVLKLHPKHRAEEVKIKMKDLLEKKCNSCSIPAITKDGEIFPIETRISEGLWNQEKVFFAVSKDITELTMSEEKFSKAFNNSGVSMLITNFKSGKISEVNNTFLDLVGYKKEEIIGKTILDLNMFRGYKEREKLIQEIDTYGKISDMEIEILNKDNNLRKAIVNIVPLQLNNHMFLLTSILDITTRIQYEEKILDISNRDYLTGVYNRRYVYSRAKEIIEEHKRTNKIFSVSIIDIDNFKLINDTYGHVAGDFILKEFTKVMNERLRPYDILGRYGGEEFILILNHADLEKSYLILKRILNYIRNKTFLFDGNFIKLTFSAGIASCQELSQDEIEIDKLVKIADRKMYLAKDNGKNEIIY